MLSVSVFEVSPARRVSTTFERLAEGDGPPADMMADMTSVAACVE